MVFLNFTLQVFIPRVQQYNWFLHFDLLSSTLLNSQTDSSNSFLDFVGFLQRWSWSSSKKVSCISFLIWMHFFPSPNHAGSHLEHQAAEKRARAASWLQRGPPAFRHQGRRSLWGFRDAFYQTVGSPSHSLISASFHQEWMWDFVKGLFCTFWDDHTLFLF